MALNLLFKAEIPLLLKIQIVKKSKETGKPRYQAVNFQSFYSTNMHFGTRIKLTNILKGHIKVYLPKLDEPLIREKHLSAISITYNFYSDYFKQYKHIPDLDNIDSVYRKYIIDSLVEQNYFNQKFKDSIANIGGILADYDLFNEKKENFITLKLYEKEVKNQLYYTLCNKAYKGIVQLNLNKK